MLIFSQFGEIAWQRLFNIVRILQTIALKVQVYGRLSPWRQVRKNIHSRVWTPGPTWSVLHPGGPPLLVPLSSCTGGSGPHPPRRIRTPVQGGYPRYHSILYSPRRASLLVPLSLDLSASLPPEFCPLPFVCFLCGTRHRAFYAKSTANWKSL